MRQERKRKQWMRAARSFRLGAAAMAAAVFFGSFSVAAAPLETEGVIPVEAEADVPAETEADDLTAVSAALPAASALPEDAETAAGEEASEAGALPEAEDAVSVEADDAEWEEPVNDPASESEEGASLETEENDAAASEAAAGAFNADTDMTVVKGTQNIPISFTINADSVSAETLKEQGYTVVNGKAAKTVACETATYTFTNLPTTLAELKTIPLDDIFAPMAASICAVAAYKQNSMYSSYNHPTFDMFDYLNGPDATISMATKSGIFSSMQTTLKTGKLAYFEGANPDNEYTPNEPYTFKLIHGPYYIPANSESIAYGSTPERHMILISFAGDDSQRYIDVWQAKDNNWYSWGDSFTHLIAGMRPLTSPIWSTDPIADGTLKPDRSSLKFDFAKHATVTEGYKEIYTEFQINTDTTSKEELQAEGYEINGGVASKITRCETRTYTFNKLPTNLNDLLTIPLDNKFGPMAAGICALATYEEKGTSDMMYKHPIYDLFEYLNGGFEIGNVARSGIYYSMKQTLSYGKLAYFEGASPGNHYTPEEPYTFTLVESPYYISAKSDDINYGTTPERRMILISFAGDDAQRYVDVWQTTKGSWFMWDNSWQHLVAGMRPMKSTIFTTDTADASTGTKLNEYGSVEKGKKTTHIEFKINTGNITEQELAAQGYTVTDGVASKDVECETATYTFNKLPKTLKELKEAIPLKGDKFGPMAAAICAVAAYEPDNSTDAMYKHSIYDMIEYLNGGFELSNVARSGIYETLKSTLSYGKMAYFEGAAPNNNYEPNTPYTFTLVESPYYIPARTNDIIFGETPERRMILISFAGDDSQRYVDVFASEGGYYYVWDNSWQHLVAGMRPSGSMPWSTDTADKNTGSRFSQYGKVVTGRKTTHIEFEINDASVTKQELERSGYTVEGSVASKDVMCDTATYTFTKLPKTLEELKEAIPLKGDKFGPMAAAICAVAAYEPDNSMDAMYKHSLYDMIEYVNGGFTVSNAARSGIYETLKATLAYGKMAYFNGATPSNGYKPDEPYTFTLVESPYYIPARTNDIIYGETPERRMILISFAGDDAQRYVDVFASNAGYYYVWDNSWQHLVAGMRPTGAKPWSTDTADKNTGMSFGDYGSVETGKEKTHIKFKINSASATQQELEKNGYTIKDGVAEKDVECDTATYTFDKLPRNLQELKEAIPLNSKFGPMAAAICAAAAYTPDNSSNAMYSHPIFDMMDYANGGFAISNVARSGIYETLKATLAYGKLAYFNGAAPANNYIPTKPYTFKLVESPYVIPARTDDINYGETPERRMILISFAGDDAQRYVDVYASNAGYYYIWDNSWQHLVAEMKASGTAPAKEEGVLTIDLPKDEEYFYTGEKIIPTAKVYWNETLLTEGADYTVSAANNLNATTNKPAVLTVVLKGGLSGKDTKNFEILPRPLGDGTHPAKGFTVGALSVVKGKKPSAPVIMYGTYQLQAKDYTLEHGDYSKAGTSYMTISGKGNFSKSMKVAVSVVENKNELKALAVSVIPRKEVFFNPLRSEENTKKELLALLKVTDKADKKDSGREEGVDFVVTWPEDVTSVGNKKVTVVGIGDYTGVLKKTLTVKPCKDDKLVHTNDSAIADGIYTYTPAGVTLEGALEVWYQPADSEQKAALEPGKDYTVKYSNNKAASTDRKKAKYTIQFLGSYKGMKARSGEFTILPKSLGGDGVVLSGVKYLVSDMPYTGRSNLYKPKAWLSVDGTLLKASDYQVRCYLDSARTLEVGGKNKVSIDEGQPSAPVYVTLEGKGNYAGEIQTIYQVERTGKQSERLTVYDLSKLKVTLLGSDGKKLKNVSWTGEERKVTDLDVGGTIVVEYKPDKKWIELDKSLYEAEYFNNVNAGTATVVLHGNGDSSEGAACTGVKTATFKIAKMR